MRDAMDKSFMDNIFMDKDFIDRVFVIYSQLFTSKNFLFRSLEGDEKLSDIYQLEVTLLNPSNQINLKELLGSSLTIEIRDGKTTPRYLNGNVIKLSLSGREDNGDRYYIYRAVIAPTLWYLTQNKDNRIFQEKNVPEILLEILNNYQIKVENRLTYSYRVWGYCVQYQETDYNFVSRLMEHEGIYFYFTHQPEGHTLILADSPQGHNELPNYADIPYFLPERGVIANQSNIHEWSVSDQITPSFYTTDDYDFRKPRARLLEKRQNPTSYAKSDTDIFEWPGTYTNLEHAQFYAKVRQQEFEARHEIMTGKASSLGIAPGYRFNLKNAPRTEDQKAYLTINTRYYFKENRYSSSDNDNSEHEIQFDVIPAETNWRPEKITPSPKTQGPQTAEVVGPAGEVVWTDKYGRVKLKFHWDRYSSGDENSSCWVRVTSAWAGWQYGSIQVPRIGEEVVVDFINGDPDRPMITGRVYNEDNMPPWALPASATQMGMESRSFRGNKVNANMLRFEDATGRENFEMHAERNMDTSVENDQNLLVQNNQNRAIGANRSTSIGGNSATNVGLNLLNVVGLNAIGIAPVGIDVTGQHVFAAGSAVTAVGNDVKARGNVIDSTQNRMNVYPSHIQVTQVKMDIDNTVINKYSQRINAGDLTVFT